MTKKTIMAGLAALMMTACQTIGPNAELLNGEWTISEIDGETLAGLEEPAKMLIDINEKSFSGNAGCNTVNGTLEADTLKGGAVAFTVVGSTKMMCQNMEREEKFQKLLSEVKTFAVDVANGLTLCDARGKALIKLAKVTEEDGEWSIKGEWTIMSVGDKNTEGTESSAILVFDLDNSLIGGNAGCNSLCGQMSLSDYSLNFANISITTMECDPQSMEVEAAVTSALEKVEQWSVENGELKLLDANNEVLITLARN